MGDYAPGYDYTGEVRTDYGDYGVFYDEGSSMWGGNGTGPYVGAAADPSLSGAARVNYAGGFGPKAGEKSEGFAAKRVRFREDPVLAARREALYGNLGRAEAGMGGAGGAPEGDDDPLGRWYLAQQGAEPRRRAGFTGRREGAEGYGGLGGALGGGLGGALGDDRVLLVLIFALVLYLVVVSMVKGAVREVLAEQARGAYPTG